MDPNFRKKKAPPIPKFQQNNAQSSLKVTDKVEDFLNEIEKEVQGSNNTVKQVKVEVKKGKMANLNSKLNSFLTSKKIDLNKMSENIKKVNKDMQDERKQVEIEYDPKTPNSYEQAKSHYIEKLEKLKRLNPQNQSIRNISHDMQVEDLQVQMEEESTQLQEKQSLALRMMQKYGYRVGEGLGKNCQGITTPLTIKKTTDTSCIIEPSSLSLVNFMTAEEAAENALKAHKVEITKVIVLSIKLRLQEMTEQIEADIKEECLKYGQMKSWILYMLGEQIRIFVEYQNREGGLRAFANLNGRFYDSKIMYVHFYDESRFKQKALGDEFHLLIDL